MIGIAIMAYNRPALLRDLLDGLAQNDLSDCVVHLWQDGTRGEVPNVEDDRPAIEASIRVFEQAELPAKELHTAERNLCCAAQRMRIMPYMAERYERFICMDNDIIVSPWCVTHLRTLLEQYADDERWGSVSAAMKLYCQPGQEREYRDKVEPETFDHLWCEGYWSDKFARMWPWYEQYYERVKHKDYRAVGELRADIAKWSAAIGCTATILGPSSDEALHRARLMAGYGRLRMVVNRATGTGDNGLHMYPDLMVTLGVGHQPLHTWEDEGDITEFTLINYQGADK